MVDGSIPVTCFLPRRFPMLSRLTFAALTLLVAGVFLYSGTTQAQGQDAKVLAKGEFHNAEKASKGTATVYELADGKRVLRLSNFRTDKGRTCTSA
jgi:hypothetical protein